MRLGLTWGSCGTRELFHLTDPLVYSHYTTERFLTDFLAWTDHSDMRRFAFVWFSHNTTESGRRTVGLIKDAIQKYKLGTVIENTPVLNPNSGYPIILYVWTVDWNAVNKLRELHKPTIKVSIPYDRYPLIRGTDVSQRREVSDA